MALDQNYHELWFQSFRRHNTAGHRKAFKLRLLSDQELPSEIITECSKRSVDPFTLLAERSNKLLDDYPVGTKFLLKSKLTDREGGGLFFYSYYGWSPLEIEKPS